MRGIKKLKIPRTFSVYYIYNIEIVRFVKVSGFSVFCRILKTKHSFITGNRPF